MADARDAPPLSRSEQIVLLLLSLVFFVVGTIVFFAALSSGSAQHKIGYLTFQISLGMLILYLSRGNGWLIMLPLASQSVALFSPRIAAIPCIIITLGVAWMTSRMLPNWVPLMQSTMVFGAAISFAAVFTNISIQDARRREQVERLATQLEEANRYLRDYAIQVEELAAVQERNRLAREIHDGLGHYLTAMHVQLNLADRLIDKDPGRAREVLSKMQSMLSDALADVRRSVAALRSEPILGINLLDAIHPLVDESRAAGLAVELSVNGETRSLPAAIELTLYRTVEEGLTNVQKHAQARRAIIRLDYLLDEVQMLIQDDGQGSFLDLSDFELLKSSFGLFGLRERAQLLGGKLTIQTAPGQGFRLEISLPVKPAYALI